MHVAVVGRFKGEVTETRPSLASGGMKGAMTSITADYWMLSSALSRLRMNWQNVCTLNEQLCRYTYTNSLVCCVCVCVSYRNGGNAKD